MRSLNVLLRAAYMPQNEERGVTQLQVELNVLLSLPHKIDQ